MNSITFRIGRIVPSLALLSLLIAGCTPGEGAGPSAWLDKPLDGDNLPLEPQTLMAHASDVDGVSRVEFLIGDTSLGTVPVDGSRFVEARAGWSPTTPGMYLVRVRAVDRGGSVGPEALARVQIGDLPTPTPVESASFTPPPTPTSMLVTVPAVTATATPARPTAPSTWTPTLPVAAPLSSPTQTPTLLIVRPTNTVTPIPTRTATPSLTPTPACPGAPVIQSFGANPLTIMAGQSTTLSWGAVLNASSAVVDPDVGGIATPGSAVVQPGQTTTYTLTATGCGGTVRRQVTVLVNRPPQPTATPTQLIYQITAVLDRWPPAISNLSASPMRISVVSGKCANKPQSTTVTARVTDASGVQTVLARYYLNGVRSEKVMSPIGGDQYRAALGGFSVSGSLDIYVVATDARNNTGQAGPVNVIVDACID